ncbi:terpenoid synthase [Aspergillus sclerotioniger CBS 115572]|uniref:Terpenoid synthase n=1 Tax=Aspergillus sclerotioniger CBS 115572 TaxID=1450535 RepID=A0A317VQP4_9EURO|nr:terpenoid synthase [Aspergillus sclerotioniger CBS 115572]PWY75212.1 terpenoid synthase [Aspergillus sclerotioniger CBS 115572]
MDKILYGTLCQQLLDKLSYDKNHVPFRPFSQDLPRPSWSTPAEWNAAIMVSKLFYFYIDEFTQQKILLFVAHFWRHDRGDPTSVSAAKTFVPTLLSSTDQLPQVQQDYISLLHSLSHDYNAFDIGRIFKSVVDFMSGVIAEAEFLPRISQSPPSDGQFLRRMTGMGDAFAHLCFPRALNIPPEDYILLIPELDNFMDHVNDVLSFYKESIVGEEAENHILRHARLNGVSVQESVEHFMMLAEQSAGNIRRLAACTPELQRVMELFLQGYIRFNTECPRYRLKECMQGIEYRWWGV